MNVLILRDPEEARRFLLQGLWTQRAVAPVVGNLRQILQWTMEIVAGGQPLLPTGVIADFGHAALGSSRETRSTRDQRAIPGFPPTLLRTYEDHVLGKLHADWTFERASDALRRFQGRDRSLGLAYVIRQFRDRAGLGGVELSPGVVRSLLETQPEDLLRRGWNELTEHGPMPVLVECYTDVIAAARRMAEFLALEDVLALEQRTALADMGQYVAHRQILQTAQRLEEFLPRQKVRPLAGRQEVPTRILDEDVYPVGGFSSISTRGSMESLLHSQLAFMESDLSRRPDLFDVKFLRDELYYYSRDENQFLRRRRAFLFVLRPDLVRNRFKDAELPVQRIVLVLALLVVAIRKLSEWLSTDALKFEFLLVKENGSSPLHHEVGLLEMLFREQIENKTVEIVTPTSAPGTYADLQAQRAMCHVLDISAEPLPLRTEHAVASRLVVDGPRPRAFLGDREWDDPLVDDAIEYWARTLEAFLGNWV